MIKQELSKLCIKLAKDELLVQGAGGNISWKEGDSLFIKASGTCLADACNKDIFVEVDLKFLKENISRKLFNVSPRLKINSQLRPSIETLFHAMISHKFVLHLHPVDILAFLVQKDAIKLLEKIMPSNCDWIMIDYYKPGEELAAKIHEQINIYSDVGIIFLKNHGVIIAAEDIEELERILFFLNTIFMGQPRQLPAYQVVDQFISLNGLTYKSIESRTLHQLAFDNDLFLFLKNNWALYPDQVVFLGEKAYLYDSIEVFMCEKDIPGLVFIKNIGVYVLGEFSQFKMQQLQCYHNILLRLGSDVELSPLESTQISELLEWDAEKYRQHLNA